ncbi:hypothetical protein ACB092_01G216100 [Castanea dentata]
MDRSRDSALRMLRRRKMCILKNKKNHVSFVELTTNDVMCIMHKLASACPNDDTRETFQIL